MLLPSQDLRYLLFAPLVGTELASSAARTLASWRWYTMSPRPGISAARQSPSRHITACCRQSGGKTTLRSFQAAGLTATTPINSPATSHLHHKSCRSTATGPLQVRITCEGVSKRRRSIDVLPNVHIQWALGAATSDEGSAFEEALAGRALAAQL